MTSATSEVRDILANTVYIDIESMFDVRLGALTLISPEIAAEMLASDYYFNRAVDKFGSIKYGLLQKKLFDEVYKQLFKEALKQSLPTLMYTHFLLILSKLRVTESAENIKVNAIHINTWPIRLDKDEANELLKTVSSVYNLTDISISIIYKDPATFTVNYINNTYLTMVVYNHFDLLKAIRDDVVKNAGGEDGFNIRNASRVTDCIIYAPRLAKDDIKKEWIDACAQVDQEIFDYASKCVSFMCTINYTPVKYYCARSNKNKE